VVSDCFRYIAASGVERGILLAEGLRGVNSAAGGCILTGFDGRNCLIRRCQAFTAA
jgi:hypothetical protein